MKIIRLHKGREESILRRHPWVFSRAIHQDSDVLSDGDTVLVQDFRGNVLGTGHYQNSSLAVRLFAFEEVNPDENFWKSRLENAFQYRTALGIPKLGYTNAYRLVHGEGDQLPGLIVDVYGSVAVLQAHSIGMHRALPVIAKSLLGVQGLGIEFVFDKSKDALPTQFGQAIEDAWLTSNGPNECEVLEQGFRFAIYNHWSENWFFPGST